MQARSSFGAACVTLALAALLAGCASSQALRRAREAERRQDYDRAVAEYTRLVKQDPDNAEARLALQRTRLRAADAHFNRGRRLAAAGRLDEALIEFQIASELNPASAEIDNALKETRNQARARIAVAGEGRKSSAVSPREKKSVTTRSWR